MNMHDQFMGMNTIEQPFLSCLPAFYTLAIPMSCYISNIFYYFVIIKWCVTCDQLFCYREYHLHHGHFTKSRKERKAIKAQIDISRKERKAIKAQIDIYDFTLRDFL